MERDSPFAVVAKYQRQAPVDVDAIAKELGINVQYTDLGSEVSGQIMKDSRKGGFSGFYVLVNSSHHPKRQRFTLAHEIAHYILHRDLIECGLVDDTMYRSELSSTYETQANRMAADILMPVMLVKSYRAKGNDLLTLANLFQVSEGAMKIRLDGLAK